MHIFFSGIGGTAISSLALIAHEAGYEVSGSDARPSQYLEYLKQHGVTNTHIGVDRDFIASVHAKNPIDWFVYGSAQPMDFPNHPEFAFCEENNIKQSKRDEFLSQFITDKNLKLIAVAGTHGKTTTTAMLVWLAQKLDLKASWSVGGKISFGDIGHFEPHGQYFIYEADEFDRNFLSFYPHISLIAGIDWDHPDIYPTRESYLDAFREFLDQSQRAVLWHTDAEALGLDQNDKYLILDDKAPDIDRRVTLAGHVNRLDAWLVVKALAQLPQFPIERSLEIINRFPGLSRRFEQIVPGLYTDYAHTPPKIRGALQLAHETAGDNVVVVYEGLHNTRQHFIKIELADLFDGVKQLYVVPSYLAREDKNLELLTPDKILNLLSNSTRNNAHTATLDDELKQSIKKHIQAGDLVLFLSAGGAGSLDDWIRKEFKQ